MNDWVKQNQGIVAVNIQYRLGLLGFLASDVVAQDGDLNAGLLDQRAALSWIQRHIGNFGGNPQHVTISGQSAGASSVVYQMVAYQGRDDSLFQGAIAQSIGTDPIPTPDIYESCFQNATRHIGCDGPSTAQDIMSCLRSASVGAIVSAINNRGTCKFLPVIDGTFLADLPTRLIQAGKMLNISYVGGHTTDDGSVFVGDPSKIATDEDFVNSILKRYTGLSEETVEQMKKLYPLEEFGTQGARAIEAFGDTCFTCQDWYIGQKLEASGVKRVWTYRFNTPDPVQLAANPWEGVMHTSELFYLFDGTNSGPNAANAQVVFAKLNDTERQFASGVIGYWTGFAEGYNPNGAGRVEWTAGSSVRLVLDETGSHVEDVSEEQKMRCEFWNAVGGETRV